jgi:hypothetical protein
VPILFALRAEPSVLLVPTIQGQLPAIPVLPQIPRPFLFPLKGRNNLSYPKTLPFPGITLRIFGVTRDSGGTALPGCSVHLFRTADDVEVDQVTSDASGNYEFRSASASNQYYVVAYLAGSTDTFGTTVNTLIGS